MKRRYVFGCIVGVLVGMDWLYESIDMDGWMDKRKRAGNDCMNNILVNIDESNLFLAPTVKSPTDQPNRLRLK